MLSGAAGSLASGQLIPWRLHSWKSQRDSAEPSSELLHPPPPQYSSHTAGCNPTVYAPISCNKDVSGSPCLRFASCWEGCCLRRTQRGCLSTAQDLSNGIPLGSALCLLSCPFLCKALQICHHLSWFMLYCSSDHSQQFLSFTCSDTQVKTYISFSLDDVCSAGSPSVFWLLLFLHGKTSLLSIPSSPSLTAKTYNTTPDSQLPYKTNITAKVPSCQFTLYNIYRSISHKSTVPVQALAISLLDYYSSLLTGLPAEVIHNVVMPSVVNVKV